MLEIALIYFLCKKMGALLRSRGWNTTFWMQLLVVLTYMGSLLVGVFGYTIYIGITQGEEALRGVGLEAYLAGYVFVAICVGLLFFASTFLGKKTGDMSMYEPI